MRIAASSGSLLLLVACGSSFDVEHGPEREAVHRALTQASGVELSPMGPRLVHHQTLPEGVLTLKVYHVVGGQPAALAKVAATPPSSVVLSPRQLHDFQAHMLAAPGEAKGPPLTLEEVAPFLVGNHETDCDGSEVLALADVQTEFGSVVLRVGLRHQFSAESSAAQSAFAQHSDSLRGQPVTRPSGEIRRADAGRPAVAEEYHFVAYTCADTTPWYWLFERRCEGTCPPAQSCTFGATNVCSCKQFTPFG
jgi:hypothetical protein